MTGKGDISARQSLARGAQTDSVAWSVYIILASDGSLYTGITTDIRRRYRQHATGVGAKYFHRGRRPVRVLYRETGHTKSSASRREAAIKQLPRLHKWRLIEAYVK